MKLYGSNLLPTDSWVLGLDGKPQVGLGYGASLSVVVDPKALRSPQGLGTMGWGGAASTVFWVDPQNDLYFVWMVQRGGDPFAFRDDLVRLVYEALADPSQ
jgi:CubicO group peptidase (beta-lactamase class C family)